MRSVNFRARHVLVLLALAASAGPALAQTPSSTRSLSVDEAVRLALEQNLGIQIERLNPQIQDIAVAQARSFWAPTVSSTLSILKFRRSGCVALNVIVDRSSGSKLLNVLLEVARELSQATE